jgi:hypothetical protein
VQCPGWWAVSVDVEVGPWFKVPKGVFRGGTAGSMGPHATAVYVALCEHANRKSSNTFSVSDKALASDTGVAERTIREIRTALVEQELITCSRGKGQSYTYVLSAVPIDWVPIKSRPRRKRKPRALQAARLALLEAGQSPAALAGLAVPSGKVC